MKRVCPVRLRFAPAPLALVAVVLIGHLTADAHAQTLRGSRAALDRQNAQAQAHGFTYLRSAEDVRRFVELGHLVPVVPNEDFVLHGVSFPYARPAVRVFIERFAAEYRRACNEQLVVTSLTRPTSTQPRNASSRSVHPTGMAVDFRRTTDPRCRRWVESALLSLERQGVLNATYERNPPHYHVSVFPEPYGRHVAQVTGDDEIIARAAKAGSAIELEWVTHRVARGETLSELASRYGTAIARIQAENRLRGHRILVGQELRIPVYRESSAPAPVRLAEAEPGPETQTGRGTDLGAEAEPSDHPGDADELIRHRVNPGESLWTIARRHGTTVDELRRANGITSGPIHPGQILVVPLPR